MIVEKVSEEETTQVQMSRSARQTVIEEVITRVNETEQEIFEEKPIGKLANLCSLCHGVPL